MYYVMNIPEICVLLFILFLWVLSIFCCIKRYEKIRTIERADMPRINKQTESIKNETFGSNSSLDRRNALTKSNTNLIYDNKSLNKTTSNVNIIGNVLADKASCCKQTRMTNSSLINLKQFQHNNNNNNNNYKNATFSQHSDLESRKLIMTYSPTGLTARSSVEPNMKNSIILYEPKTNTYKQSVYLRNETTRPEKTKKMAYFSLNFLNYSNGCLNTTDEMKQRLQSTSEPLLFDESNYESNLFMPTAIAEMPESHAETTSSTQLNKRTRSKRGYHKLSCRKRGLHDSSLLNPERIPRLIRKSLLDLHQKSILNLANQRTNSTGDYLAKPYRTNKAARLNAANECNSRVFTQQRNPYETKMKIRNQ